MKKSQNIGLGLRKEHYSAFLSENPQSMPIDTLEIISENYFRSRGKGFHHLLKLRQDYQMSCHGVSLSLARLDEIDWQYLEDLKSFYRIIDPKITSDHLCFTGLGHSNTHNLLPFVYDQKNLQLIGERIIKIQDFLKRELVVENLSMYLKYRTSTMEEFEFMQLLHQKYGVCFLLDLNNIIVNQKNFNCNPLDYLDHLPHSAVKELHLAGHRLMDGYAFDTHGESIGADTLNLFIHAIKKYPNALIILERDENIPPLPELMDEIKLLQNTRENIRDNIVYG